MKWPFADPKTRACYTTQKILDGGDWIQWVCHDAEDGCWQFQGQQTEDEPVAVSLLTIYQLHPALADLADLPLGWQASRETREGAWERRAQFNYDLDDAVVRHRANPDTFDLPPEKERLSLKTGDLAKLIFRIQQAAEITVERMWVEVKKARKGSYTGSLANQPVSTSQLASGDEVKFGAEHIIEIRRKS